MAFRSLYPTDAYFNAALYPDANGYDYSNTHPNGDPGANACSYPQTDANCYALTNTYPPND